MVSPRVDWSWRSRALGAGDEWAGHGPWPRLSSVVCVPSSLPHPHPRDFLRTRKSGLVEGWTGGRLGAGVPLQPRGLSDRPGWVVFLTPAPAGPSSGLPRPAPEDGDARQELLMEVLVRPRPSGGWSYRLHRRCPSSSAGSRAGALPPRGPRRPPGRVQGQGPRMRPSVPCLQGPWPSDPWNLGRNGLSGHLSIGHRGSGRGAQGLGLPLPPLLVLGTDAVGLPRPTCPLESGSLG